MSEQARGFVCTVREFRIALQSGSYFQRQAFSICARS